MSVALSIYALLQRSRLSVFSSTFPPYVVLAETVTSYT